MLKYINSVIHGIFVDTLGALAILGGAMSAKSQPVLMLDGTVRGKNCFDPHAHQCILCKLIWEHDPRKIVNLKQNIAAHTCPACGGEQYHVYKGNEKASCINCG